MKLYGKFRAGWLLRLFFHWHDLFAGPLYVAELQYAKVGDGKLDFLAELRNVLDVKVEKRSARFKICLMRCGLYLLL